MGEGKTCKNCGKPATVHLTQISGTDIHKLDLCESCAAEKGISEEGFNLGEILAPQASALVPARAELVCDQCGFTASEFRKRGRLGCPHCYERFKPILAPALPSMHRGCEHQGKIPSNGSAVTAAQRQRLAFLENQLRQAVEQENYEAAASCRDEIRQIRAALAQSTP